MHFNVSNFTPNKNLTNPIILRNKSVTKTVTTNQEYWNPTINNQHITFQKVKLSIFDTIKQSKGQIKLTNNKPMLQTWYYTQPSCFFQIQAWRRLPPKPMKDDHHAQNHFRHNNSHRCPIETPSPGLFNITNT